MVANAWATCPTNELRQLLQACRSMRHRIVIELRFGLGQQPALLTGK